MTVELVELAETSEWGLHQDGAAQIQMTALC